MSVQYLADLVLGGVCILFFVVVVFARSLKSFNVVYAITDTIHHIFGTFVHRNYSICELRILFAMFNVCTCVQEYMYM